MGTLTDARNRLAGTWTLVSLDLFPPGQPPIHDAASGIMSYDEYSNLKVDLRLTPACGEACPEDWDPAHPGGFADHQRPRGNRPRARALSYVLEGQKPMRQAMHPLDTNLPRYWELNGNELTLRTKDEKGTVLSVAVWRKN